MIESVGQATVALVTTATSAIDIGSLGIDRGIYGDKNATGVTAVACGVVPWGIARVAESGVPQWTTTDNVLGQRRS
jgi:hypothetical protein